MCALLADLHGVRLRLTQRCRKAQALRLRPPTLVGVIPTSSSPGTRVAAPELLAREAPDRSRLRTAALLDVIARSGQASSMTWRRAGPRYRRRDLALGAAKQTRSNSVAIPVPEFYSE